MIKINNEYVNYEAVYLGTVQHGLMINNTPAIMVGVFAGDELVKSYNVTVKIQNYQKFPKIGNDIDILEINGSELMGYTAKIGYLEQFKDGTVFTNYFDYLNDLKNIGIYKLIGVESDMDNKVKKVELNGKVLKNVRNYMGLNQKNFSDILKISERKLRDVEKESKLVENIDIEPLVEQYSKLNNPLNLQFDWVSFNFPELTGEDVIKQVLGIKSSLFLVRGTSQNFYTREFVYGGEKNIYVQDFEPDEDGVQKNGTTLFLTGIGTRLFENALIEQGMDWKQFFEKMYQFQGHCTRLDVAINDTGELLDMNNIVSAVQEKRFYSKSRSYAVHGNKEQGWTVNFGKSPFVIRIYDKFKEQAGKGKLTAVNTRVELELHTDKAKQLIDEWLGKDNLVGFTFDILNTYLLFVDEPTNDEMLKGHNDRERYYDTLRPMPEWSLFTALGGSMKFINDPKKINIDSVMNWLEKYVAPSLKLIQQTGKWNDLLETIIESELSPEQEALVKAFNTRQMSESAVNPKTIKIENDMELENNED